MRGHRFSDQDVERLFCGEIPDNQALATLSPVLSALQSVSWPSPTEERVRRFATKAAEIAQAAEPGQITGSPRRVSRSGWLPSLSRGLATGVASILVFSGMTAIAIASDDAAPGDVLYGVDRALEAVGIGDGSAAERIAEARVLFDRGEVTAAIDHASEAVIDSGDDDGVTDFSPEASNAAAALQAAADKVQANDQAQSQQVRNAVSAMLAEMAAMMQDPAIEGKEFGQKVAEMAGTIGGKDNAGPPEDTPGSPENNPGPPESTPGKPDTTPDQSNGGSSGQSGRP
jgi:hypothetical protein